MENEAKYRIEKKLYRKYLRWVYDAINKELFNGELPKIPIRTQRLDDDFLAVFYTRSHIKSFYIGGKSCFHKVEHISIGVNSKMAYLNDITEFHFRNINSVFHEMVHEYNYLHGVSDVTGAAGYHNSGFLVAMEEHGGICDRYHEIYGFDGNLQEDALLRIIEYVEKEEAKAIAQSANEAA